MIFVMNTLEKLNSAMNPYSSEYPLTFTPGRLGSGGHLSLLISELPGDRLAP